MFQFVFSRNQLGSSGVVREIPEIGMSSYHDGGDELWLVGSGVSSDWISLAALVEETRSEMADVAVFSTAGRDALRTAAAFEGIVMIREDLMERVLSSPAALSCLEESGILAAAITVKPDLRALNWKDDERFRRHFHPDYPNCGNTPVVPGIRFPVTDAGMREATRAQYLDLADRMGSRVARYQGEKHRGWFLTDCRRWQELFGMDEPARVLEICATDGVNTNAMLDLLFPHPASEVHVVKSGDSSGPQEFFERNAAVSGRGSQLHLYEGGSTEILAWMISSEGYWESFDFVYLTADREPLAALTAACQAWPLLKPGGAMVMDPGEKGNSGAHPALGGLAAFFLAAGGVAPEIGGSLMVLRKGESK